MLNGMNNEHSALVNFQIHRNRSSVIFFTAKTYKMNSGAFLTLKRLAVLMPRVSLSTRATFTRFRSAAPTEKNKTNISIKHSLKIITFTTEIYDHFNNVYANLIPKQQSNVGSQCTPGCS